MSVDYKDYYATLGVSRDASAEEIRKAFRKLARHYHPDVAGDKPDAEERFKEINEANEVLGDPEKRRTYDELGANWQQPHGGFPGGPRHHAAPDTGHEFHFGGTGFSDFFEHYFSGASRYGFPGEAFAGRPSAGESRGRRGSDIEGDILVTLEEAMHGALRPLSLQLVDPASGRLQTHDFQVRIPPGVTNGRRIRVPGQGEPGIRGGEPGDLYLRVRHAAHPDPPGERERPAIPNPQPRPAEGQVRRTRQFPRRARRPAPHHHLRAGTQPLGTASRRLQLQPPHPELAMTRPADPRHAPAQAQPDDPEHAYSVEVVARLTGVSADEILHYKEQGLIRAPAVPAGEDPRFGDETVRVVRRIQYLRSSCGVNEAGLRLILRLTEELERLSELLHTRR